MDIYAQEVSKMQSVSKTSAPVKKRNFDATQFNAYGLPLGNLNNFLAKWIIDNWNCQRLGEITGIAHYIDFIAKLYTF